MTLFKKAKIYINSLPFHTRKHIRKKIMVTFLRCFYYKKEKH